MCECVFKIHSKINQFIFRLLIHFFKFIYCSLMEPQLIDFVPQRILEKKEMHF